MKVAKVARGDLCQEDVACFGAHTEGEKGGKTGCPVPDEPVRRAMTYHGVVRAKHQWTTAARLLKALLRRAPAWIAGRQRVEREEPTVHGEDDHFERCWEASQWPLSARANVRVR
jgi:hypothetical protein